MKRLHKSQAQRARGFTLIEVMIALVVLSLGLLGLAGLQLYSLKNTSSAYSRTQATLLANEMIERVRSNPEGAYDFGEFIPCNGNNRAEDWCENNNANTCANDTCSAADRALFDRHAVVCGGDEFSGIDSLLPMGCMGMTCTETKPNDKCGRYELIIGWQEVLVGEAVDNNENDAPPAVEDNVPEEKQISISFAP